jgi:hypothetical protein
LYIDQNWEWGYKYCWDMCLVVVSSIDFLWTLSQLFFGDWILVVLDFLPSILTIASTAFVSRNLQHNQLSIMEAINSAFATCKRESRAALVTYVTAGYPTATSTPDIMLAMQAGGAGQSPAPPQNYHYPTKHIPF